MAINIDALNRKKMKADTIEALNSCIVAIENCVDITKARFYSESEYDEVLKNSGVWAMRYPNEWSNLSIELRYKTRNTGECKNV